MQPTTSKIISIILLSLFLSGCQLWSASASKSKYKEFLGSGDELPITKITDVDGNLIELDSPGKKKLVILFATWCSDSNRALKALNQSPMLNDENLEVVAIAREESEDTVKAWRKTHSIKVPLAVDLDRNIYRQFAEAGIPRLITVSKDNKIIKMNLAEGESQLDLIQWN
ncbi:MAG: redoxin family protein [Kangiellaceae bacterium]|nr:redoxin family protein [Kangiellaceae bacterium]MCW8999174.1 redoxin family protein [Kangiellaceae bacterium]